MSVAVNTLVVGGGQAGLAVSYYLKRRPQDHLVLEQADRPGNAWCNHRLQYAEDDPDEYRGDGYPRQTRGVTAYPGLFFVGLPWLHTAKSGLIYGVGEDAAYIAEQIAIRTNSDIGVAALIHAAMREFTSNADEDKTSADQRLLVGGVRIRDRGFAVRAAAEVCSVAASSTAHCAVESEAEPTTSSSRT